MLLQSIVLKLLNFIYPPHCYLCDVSVAAEGVCGNCFNKLQSAYKNCCSMCGIELQTGDICLDCLAKPKIFDSASYCFIYNSEIFKLISGFKNHDKTYMSKFISSFLIKKVYEKALADKIDVIIPVPIHYRKLIKRKYNHTAMLAYEIAKYFHKPLICRALKKNKKTDDQIKLGGQKRIINVKGAFNINKNNLKFIKGKNILLVDDVLTTGATINECAMVLKKSGCRTVHVLCFSRVDGALKV
ncbi:MAG: ComF family protein [Alphaproteobacteria bacterium]|nr:ComF family protein [Alphaproteobacteria bacterium]